MTSSNGKISVSMALCEGNSSVTGEFPAQRPVTRSFDLRLNKRLSIKFDLRRHRAHYDAIVIDCLQIHMIGSKTMFKMASHVIIIITIC